LAPVAEMLKQKYGFRWFGVWHTINGYWDGVDPASMLGKVYRLIKAGTRYTVDPFAPSGYRFWLDYYRDMRQAGVELVKIDNSSAIANLFEGTYAFNDAIKQVIATEHGAAASLGITVLNCLGAAHDSKFHWAHANAARITDDFSPGNFNSTKKLVHQYANGTLQMAPFCWPDADMFYTGHITSEILAYLHMISGGPVYIADEVGATDPAMVDRMSFPDGRLPRLSMPAMPTADVVFQDMETNAACKLWNYHDIPGWGRVFYVFVANIIVEDKPCIGKFAIQNIGASAFDGAREGPAGSYVVKEANDPACAVIERESGEVSVDLDNFESRYYCVTPIVNGIALLGIAGMFNGTRAIAKVQRIDETTIIVIPEYPGTLQVHSPGEASLEAFEITGEPVQISRDATAPEIAKIIVSDRPVRLVTRA
jgi:hypothetical protein